jgi:putative ABC transport system permease protein
MGLRYLLRRPLQSLLCVLGVALGVAVVVAIDLANSSAANAFNLSTDTVAGRATYQVVGGTNGLSEAVYRRIKVELGIQDAAPVIEGYANALELDQQPMQMLGVDVFAEVPFRSYLSGGASQTDLVNYAQFFTRPDGMLIGIATAQHYGLRVGSVVTLRVGDRRHLMHVAGILQPANEAGQRAFDNLAIMDISSAQELFGMQGLLSHIDLIADERTSAGRDNLARIQAILPPDAHIVKPQARSQSVESLTDAFELNLSALSLLALVVGMFLIYNTITFSIVQRRPVFGTLRCLGVTRGEISRLVIAESGLLGLIGSIVGLGLGIVLGRGAVSLVTRTINDLYYVVAVRSVLVDPLSLAKGFCLGVGAAVLASLTPAYEATSIPPISVLRRSNIELRVRRLLPFVAGLGMLLLTVGGAMLLLTKDLVVNLGGIFGVVVGLAIISPLVTVALMNVLTPLAGRLAGVIGRLATRTVVNSISRTAIAIASLMIAVSVIIGLQSMIGSFRNTVQDWLDATLLADIYISPPSGGPNNPTNLLDPTLTKQVKAYPGVSAVTSLLRLPTSVVVGRGEQGSNNWIAAELMVVSAETNRQAVSFVWSEGSPSEVWQAMLDQDVVQVSEPFANRYGVTRQQNLLTIQTEQGPRTFRVVGVYYDYSSNQGVILIRREVFQRYWHSTQVSSLAVYLDAVTQPRAGQVVNEMRKRFAGRDLVISANRDLRANALSVFDRTFAITGALNLLATVVAFIGVLSALMALQIERTRELGVLRANGMTLGQLWRMTLLETGLMGGTAGLLSMPTGFLLALILVYIINLRSFGWTIQMDLQWTTFAQAMLVAVLSALLACIYPMLRLRKIQIASAVRQE